MRTSRDDVVDETDVRRQRGACMDGSPFLCDSSVDRKIDAQILEGNVIGAILNQYSARVGVSRCRLKGHIPEGDIGRVGYPRNIVGRRIRSRRRTDRHIIGVARLRLKDDRIGR